MSEHTRELHILVRDLEARIKQLERQLELDAIALDELTERVRQLERNADPRTAEDAALDRWTRIVGITAPRPFVTMGRRAGKTRSQLAELAHECGLVIDEGDVDVEVTFDDLTWTRATDLLQPGVRALALAIGTRVRIDDRSDPRHDCEGSVIGYGPGGAIEIKLDDATVIAVAHRASLALVDDTLPECGECHGAGSIPLFSGVAECDACGGSGVTS